ncbi:MAG TPA: glycosyl hydrolase 108 family protein, partial [Pseudolabrys sp.]|nr:glycosyl hydrolase 108 family protein [Pseudolabrys sp.]
YDAALARVLAHEGGYSNHPADPGGPTNFGITIADYRRYVKPGATAADVKAMTVGEAKAIYRARYWDAQRCDDLPAGVDYAVFDYGVNSGIGRSGKVLRRMLRLPDDTSLVTDAVIAAAAAADAKALVAAICDERLRFLRSLKTWRVFGKGWSARVAEVRAFALQLAAGTRAKAAVAARPALPKGKGAVPLNKRAQKTSGAIVAASGAVAAQQALEKGAPPALVLAILAAAALAAFAFWTFWRWRQSKRQQAKV